MHRGQVAAEHPTMHKTAPQQRIIRPKTSGVPRRNYDYVCTKLYKTSSKTWAKMFIIHMLEKNEKLKPLIEILQSHKITPQLEYEPRTVTNTEEKVKMASKYMKI